MYFCSRSLSGCRRCMLVLGRWRGALPYDRRWPPGQQLGFDEAQSIHVATLTKVQQPPFVLTQQQAILACM